MSYINTVVLFAGPVRGPTSRTLFVRASEHGGEKSPNSGALKALLDGRVRLGESQVRLAESKCWRKELRLHVGGSVSLTLSQDGYHSVVLIAHDSIGQKIKCYLALIFAHGDTITFIAATVGN